MTTFIASYLIWIMFAGAVSLWLIDGRKLKEQSLHAIFSSILAWIISEMVKTLLPTTRPFLLNGGGIKTLTLHFDNSFPSSHAAVAFALATTIYLHDKKTGKLFLVAAFLVAIGRVMANVHFPIDVIVGGLLGFAISFSIDKAHLFSLVTKTKRK